jgi:hypothetical protein
MEKLMERVMEALMFLALCLTAILCVVVFSGCNRYLQQTAMAVEQSRGEVSLTEEQIRARDDLLDKIIDVHPEEWTKGGHDCYRLNKDNIVYLYSDSLSVFNSLTAMSKDITLLPRQIERINSKFVSLEKYYSSKAIEERLVQDLIK